MATLKDLIKTETLKVGSNASMPSTNSVNVSVTKTEVKTWEDVATYLAPFDGYIEVTAQGDGSNETATQVVSAMKHGHEWSGIRRNRLTMPVCRGHNIHISGQNFKELSVRFIKSIGGGYKRYLKALSCNRFGGSLWLRLKTIYAVSESKSSTLGCRTTTRKSFSLAGQKNTQHRLTGLHMSGISSPRQDPSQSTLAHQVEAWYSWQELSKMWGGIHGGIQSISDSLKDNGIAFRQLVGAQKSQMLPSVGSTLTSANNARMEVAA